MKEELDWEDDSGVLSLEEWEKRTGIYKNVRDDLDNVKELDLRDWIEIVVYLNKEIGKTNLFKMLFLLSERLHLNDFVPFSWRPHNYGPYSYALENELDKLVEGRLVEKEEIATSNKGVIKRFRLKNAVRVKKLLNALPPTVKKAVQDTVAEFKDKSTKEIEDYVHKTYPKYAIAAKC